MTTDASHLRWVHQPRKYRTEADWEPLRPVILDLSDEGYNAQQIIDILLSGEIDGVVCDPDLRTSDVRRILAKWGKKFNLNQKQRTFIQQIQAKRIALEKPPPEFRYKNTGQALDSQKIQASIMRNRKKDISSGQSMLSMRSTEVGLSVVTTRISATMSQLSMPSSYNTWTRPEGIPSEVHPHGGRPHSPPVPFDVGFYGHYRSESSPKALPLGFSRHDIATNEKDFLPDVYIHELASDLVRKERSDSLNYPAPYVDTAYGGEQIAEKDSEKPIKSSSADLQTQYARGKYDNMIAHEPLLADNVLEFGRFEEEFAAITDPYSSSHGLSYASFDVESQMKAEPEVEVNLVNPNNWDLDYRGPVVVEGELYYVGKSGSYRFRDIYECICSMIQHGYHSHKLAAYNLGLQPNEMMQRQTIINIVTSIWKDLRPLRYKSSRRLQLHHLLDRFATFNYNFGETSEYDRDSSRAEQASWIKSLDSFHEEEIDLQEDAKFFLTERSYETCNSEKVVETRLELRCPRGSQKDCLGLKNTLPVHNASLADGILQKSPLLSIIQTERAFPTLSQIDLEIGLLINTYTIREGYSFVNLIPQVFNVSFDVPREII